MYLISSPTATPGRTGPATTPNVPPARESTRGPAGSGLWSTPTPASSASPLGRRSSTLGVVTGRSLQGSLLVRMCFSIRPPCSTILSLGISLGHSLARSSSTSLILLTRAPSCVLGMNRGATGAYSSSCQAGGVDQGPCGGGLGPYGAHQTSSWAGVGLLPHPPSPWAWTRWTSPGSSSAPCCVGWWRWGDELETWPACSCLTCNISFPDFKSSTFYSLTLQFA